MKDLKAVKGRYYIQRLIEEGEHEHQDFKFAISDARKIARSISAFANNDGGRLLIGVKDNGTIAGVRSEEDIFVVEQAAQMYCVPRQPIEVTAYKTNPGQIVYKVEISRSTVRPVRVKEESGKFKAYFRVADENISVPQLMLRAWEGDQRTEGTILSLDSYCREILGHIEACEDGINPDRLAALTHLGVSLINNSLIKMYSMGVIDFRFAPSREFVVGLKIR